MYDRQILTFPLHIRIIYAFLRIFFNLLYNSFAWSYDLVAYIVSLGQWNGWVRSVIPYIKGNRILEIGHGPGHLQLALAEKDPGWQVIGLDLSRNMGKMARKRLHQAGYNARLVNARSERLPIASEGVDQVVATFPAEYIFHPDTLTEAWRVLIPGGRMVILPLAWITGKAPLEKAAAWLFHITGQAPAWDDRALAPLQKIGFQTHIEWIDYRSSKALVILADKP